MSDDQFQSERPESADITNRPRPIAEGQPYPDDTSDLPKLGSLAQAARHKHLKQARNTLLILGILMAVVQSAVFFMEMNQVGDEIRKQGNMTPVQAEQAEMIAKVFLVLFHGAAISVALLFVLLSFFVQRYPVPILVTALILYIGLQVVFLVTAILGGNPTAFLNFGIVIRILIVVALWKALQAGIAAQREAREAEAATAYGA
jgi:xanthosine utilization system XapX-like protein